MNIQSKLNTISAKLPLNILHVSPDHRVTNLLQYNINDSDSDVLIWTMQ